MAIRVTVWNEFRHEKSKESVKRIYPEGIHACIRDFLSDCPDMDVRIVSLDEPDNGLPDEVLNTTDVLLWWGHMAHSDVPDDLVARIRQRVYAGMGFIPLHSAHHSKPFKAIVGTTGNLTWGDEQTAILWNVNPTHPIMEGIPDHLELFEELYADPFYIPKPDDLLMVSWYEQGFIFRGAVTFTRGLGKIFYFHPGHETCASFHNPTVQQIIKNAIRWAAPAKTGFEVPDGCIHQRIPAFQKEK